ncbi:hypothetical protein [uncultured Mucilaginibacter sp.]|uniref:hypothetical protein n=1 Tax=uncultured Mucilaginibacter sp. TaxID=797541 RepID=UPI0025FB45B7|nr:hypothetical protein [uncultured Mucilaginibacter sp.]
MEHNFRVNPGGAGVINFYVSKAGNDNNDGFTPDKPKQTLLGVRNAITNLANAAPVRIIIGTGTYEEGWAGSTKVLDGSSMIGDGNVVIKGSGTTTFSFNANAGLMSVSNILIRDMGTVNLRGNVSECTFFTCNQIIQSATSSVLRSKFISINSISAVLQFLSSIFIDVPLSGQNTYFTSCYFNSNTDITLANLATIQPSNLSYCNVMGRIRVTPSGQWMSLDTFRQTYPDYFQSSFNKAPGFNNPSALDFTLNDESPHIGAASDGINNIGGTLYAKSLSSKVAPEWLNGSISMSDGAPDLIINGTDLALASGKKTGSITSTPIMVSSNVVQIQNINYNGFFLFNKSVPPEQPSNKNVPDSSLKSTDNSNASGNPDRLSYEMRWTDNPAMPSVSSDWTSTPLVSPGEYLSFEWNTKPFYDNLGIGNGSHLFNSNGNTAPVNAIWIQLRVTLSNRYE